MNAKLIIHKTLCFEKKSMKATVQGLVSISSFLNGITYSTLEMIRFGTGKVTIREMFKTGLMLEIIGVIVITASIFLLGPILGIYISQFPVWAKQYQYLFLSLLIE